MKKKSVLVATMLALNPAMEVFSEESARLEKSLDISPVEVRGILPDRLESVPGSYYLLDKKDLDLRRPFSVQEALNNVPGVNVVGENSFGLGLNIGIRGLNPRRTSRTLVMEDGVPLQLGPYGDPSLHLTTPMERIQRIEVVKGSGQILYGPQTVGGMINFVTRPVPTNGFQGAVQAMLGNNDFTGLYANAGYGNERGGVMLDVNQKKGDGIRKNHDFDVLDMTLKGQLNLTDSQKLIAKVGYYKEESHVSETGLGAAEYALDKYQAPTGNNDFFELERKSGQLTHIFDISDTARLTTNAYYVDVFRSSFRQIDTPGSNAGFSQLERCPAGLPSGNNNLANADQCGGRHRPRDFQYWGIEPRLDFQHSLFGLQSEAVIGFRYHEEDQRRRQWRGNDARAQSLSFLKANAEQPGIASAVADFREDIRIAVEAKSYYFQNTFYAGDFAITPGVRYEDIKQRTTIFQAGGNAVFNSQSNHQSKVLPGLGLAWNGITNTTVFGGVHKGFAPPRASRDLDGANISQTRAEESTNYELGLRSAYFKGVSFESTLFKTKFDDIVIEQPAGRFINAGETEQAGIELAGKVDFGTIFDSAHHFYLLGSYTNVFTADFEKGADKGNRLQYAPKHMASMSVGYLHPVGFDVRIGADYVSEQFSDSANTRVENAAGTTGTIPAYTLFNMSANYRPVGSRVTYFMSGYNLTDREYLASRVDGKVAGRPRQVFVGIRYDF
ncbi:TonB-dependent receptor family protein [Methylophilus medardicus]|uniref:TonB-dependent receptor n=1 Tax=Methylophilus medardicus TaxID=2588534 RepID=A0A5B8CTJ2_9PROT|nr:TonB-dependent receptor [Methylophilus medardicus]QDC44549.1 TonB-dependent receptor [Methylophilus medardicus]QDC49556.1 TonB-dependent receptor [Methylophilus medardicus]QDC53261.1 TonB-dependent receptor [Methylophilus medardicus]